MTILNEEIEIEKTIFHINMRFPTISGENLPVYKVGVDLLHDNLSDINSSMDTLVGLMDLSIFEIPEISLKMLIGRDVLSRCIFTYNGLDDTFSIDYKVN